jgi:hypothetical protein
MRGSVALLIVLALAACRQDAATSPAAETSSPAERRTPSPAPNALPAPTPIENSEEVQVESLLGVWRVVAVLPGAAAAFKTDDPRIVGALMDVYSDKLSWSYQASGEFSPTDLCLGPVSGVIANPEIADEVRAELGPARRRFGTEAGGLSRPHHWLCGDGGSWGDEAEFQVVGRDRMAMRWPGGLTLVLERIRRASGEPPPLPPTGAFEKR